MLLSMLHERGPRWRSLSEVERFSLSPVRRGASLSIVPSKFAWPPQCCVPAFLGTAVAMLTGTLDLLDEEHIRRNLAIASGVVVGPEDANPWGLRVSQNEGDWGVKARNIQGSLEPIESVLGCRRGLVLEIVNFDTIAFRLYEDAVIELSSVGAVVGISFDYPELTGKTTSLAGDSRPGRHVARLSPVASDQNKPNILSPEFKSDYSGDLWLFDDSGEMSDSDCLVSWPHLVRACWAVDGGLWIVRQVSDEPS